MYFFAKWCRILLLLVLLSFLADLWRRGEALAQEGPGTLMGRVVTADASAVDDAWVRVMSLGRRVRVNESGFFLLENLPAGSYLVEAESPRSGRAVERFQVLPGQTISVLLELDPLFQLDELVISAGSTPAQRSETYQPTSALTGWDLVRDAEASLGETLAEAPGVTASYNGPGSSRPIIRGLGGDRVRILESGIGSGDVSSQGPDHAVGVEPMSADRIEIVRGPAALLYGSGISGGVVNVIDSRIPRELPVKPLTGSVFGLGGSAADERTGGFETDGGGGNWAWHLSGLRRETGDVAIPGHAEHEHEEEHAEDEENPSGVLPNSAVETERGALGFSWVGEDGFFGVAVSGLNSDYGVPGHAHGHALDEHPEEGQMELGDEGDEGGVVIALEQRRFDAEGALRFSEGVVRAVEARFGYAGYEHRELEGEKVGTHFTNEQWEGRVEVDHSLLELLHGSAGIQLGGRDFEALGEEAFVPPSSELDFAAFLFQELAGECLRFQLGARAEGQRSEDLDRGVTRSHLGLSFSGGMNWSPKEEVSLAITAARSQKLPSLEELFSDGPHAATFAYEIGNPGLDPETSNTLDVTLRLSQGLFRVESTAFVNLFNDFIYQEFTGEEEGGFPVLTTVQGDALFMGWEGSVEFDLLHQGRHHLLVEGWGDYVRAELRETSDALPRIPPLRLGTRLRYNGGTIRADLGLTAVTDQNRVAPLEEETEGYSMVDMSVGYRLFTGEITHDLVFRATNLTDQEARNHTSFLKELAPLPGRDLRFMYRVYF